MPADILIYALVAAGLVFWLRNILGTRHEDEPQRPNPFTSNSLESQSSSAEQADHSSAKPSGDLSVDVMKSGLERSMVIGDLALPVLLDIARTDRSFNAAQFLTGAQDAFVMIVEAFAEGDKETLKGLLSDSVYAAFSAVVDERNERGEKGFVEIHAIRKSEIIAATLEKKIASITVKFVADETNVLYDKGGKALSGHPDHVTETIDVWTFSRDLRSKSPAWLLTETRDEDAQDRDHKTVPDGGGQ